MISSSSTTNKLPKDFPTDLSAASISFYVGLYLISLRAIRLNIIASPSNGHTYPSDEFVRSDAHFDSAKLAIIAIILATPIPLSNAPLQLEVTKLLVHNRVDSLWAAFLSMDEGFVPAASAPKPTLLQRKFFKTLKALHDLKLLDLNLSFPSN